MAVPWPEIVAHRERLIQLARRRVPSQADAEDVVSEAMLRCATFERLDTARLGQFLTAVTVRLCADLYRDAERGAKLARRLDLGDEPSPEDLACEAADARMLHELLDSLPDSQRAVLVDRADGLSVSQISARHSLTYKAVESALSRARASMRTALASAMATAFAAAEALRRRPAVEVALPAATVVFASAVVAPFLLPGPVGGEATTLAKPPSVARDDGQRAGTPLVATAGRTPAPRPYPTPTAVPGPTLDPGAAPHPKPSASTTYVRVEDGVGGYHEINDDDDQILLTEEEIRDCVRNGVDSELRVRVGPSPSFGGGNNCDPD